MAHQPSLFQSSLSAPLKSNYFVILVDFVTSVLFTLKCSGDEPSESCKLTLAPNEIKYDTAAPDPE